MRKESFHIRMCFILVVTYYPKAYTEMTRAGIRTYRITLAIRTHRLLLLFGVVDDFGFKVEEEVVVVMMVRRIDDPNNNFVDTTVFGMDHRQEEVL
jgi:hypothetical protein